MLQFCLSQSPPHPTSPRWQLPSRQSTSSATAANHRSITPLLLFLHSSDRARPPSSSSPRRGPSSVLQLRPGGASGATCGRAAGLGTAGRVPGGGSARSRDNMATSGGVTAGCGPWPGGGGGPLARRPKLGCRSRLPLGSTDGGSGYWSKRHRPDSPSVVPTALVTAAALLSQDPHQQLVHSDSQICSHPRHCCRAPEPLPEALLTAESPSPPLVPRSSVVAYLAVPDSPHWSPRLQSGPLRQMMKKPPHFFYGNRSEKNPHVPQLACLALDLYAPALARVPRTTAAPIALASCHCNEPGPRMH